MRVFFTTLLLLTSLFVYAKDDIRLLHTKVSQVRFGEPIKLEANITNAQLVNYIIVNYRYENEKHWSQIEMTPQEGRFACNIPAAVDNISSLSYYIEVFDVNEKVASSFANQKEPQVIQIKGFNEEKKRAITIEGKDKNVEIRTIDEDFEIYISELESMQNVGITTASKILQKASDAPATVYVITEDMIKKRGYTNLEDVLDDIPGVEIQKKSTAEYENYITVRGISGNDKLVILMDGFKISPTDNTPMTVGTNYPLIAVKQVEVILGPASALYGPDAVNGIVNIITKTGKDINGLEITSSYGNATTTLNEFAGGFEADGISFMTTGHFYHSDEPFYPSIYKDEYEWYNTKYKTDGKVLISPFVQIERGVDEIEPYGTPTDSFSIHSKLNYKDVEFGYFISRESHSTSLGGKPEFNIYAEDAIYKTTVQTFYGKHHLTSTNEKFQLTTSLWYGSYEIHPDTQFNNQFTGFLKAYKYGLGRTIKFEEQLTLTFSPKYILVAGFSFDKNNSLPESSDLPRKYDTNKSADEQKIEYPGTNMKDYQGNDLTIYEDFYYLEYNNIGGYLQFQALPTESFQLTLGARGDYNTRYGSSFNPRAGIVLTPSNFMKMKLLYGQAFLAPSPFYSYQHYGAFVPRMNNNGTPDNSEDDYVEGLMGYFWRVINPNLKPEKLSSLEGSIILNPTNNLTITLNGYFQKLDDLITSQTDFAGDNIDDWHTDFKNIPVQTYATRINRGTTESWGGSIRFDLFFKFSSIFSLMPYITYSYSDGELDGYLIPYNARHTIKGGIDGTVQKLYFSTRFIYRGRSYHKQVYEVAKAKRDDFGKSELDQYSSDPYFILNLDLRYDLIYGFSLFANISNLLNTKHYNVALADNEGFIATPQDTFRILGGLIYKW
ncbi:TonB-dependent receptor [bacterium]|nr:TonB-dependent receptor [bacterium]